MEISHKMDENQQSEQKAQFCENFVMRIAGAKNQFGNYIYIFSTTYERATSVNDISDMSHILVTEFM